MTGTSGTISQAYLYWHGPTNSDGPAFNANLTVSGDGTYSIAGLEAGNTNGAALVVFYDDGDDSNNIDVVSFDGNDANFNTAFESNGWDVTLSHINHTSGDAFLSMSVSDGQRFTDGSFLLNGVYIGAAFNGVTVPNTPGSSVGRGGL